MKVSYSELKNSFADKAFLQFFLYSNFCSIQLNGYSFPKEEEVWTFDQLQAYVMYVKNRFQPRLTMLAEHVLSAYYQKQRNADSRNAGMSCFFRYFRVLVRFFFL